MTDIWTTLDPRDALALALLAVVLLQHPGTAENRTCMGRDGRVHHRGIEVTGAMRGVVALAALMPPVTIVLALDALSSPARFELYLRSSVAMLWLWIPITVVALVGSFAVNVAMQTSRVTRRWCYSRPVTLDGLGVPLGRRRMTS